MRGGGVFTTERRRRRKRKISWEDREEEAEKAAEAEVYRSKTFFRSPFAECFSPPHGDSVIKCSQSQDRKDSWETEEKRVRKER